MSIENEYFEWLYDTICNQRYANGISYKKLLSHVHSMNFTWLIPNDKNRAADGVNLRRRFAMNFYPDSDYDYVLNVLDGPCSVFEMLVALAVRCEEALMDDASLGNRTSQWFWNMLVNLGLGGMNDTLFDASDVDAKIGCFLNREYEQDGKGGLFTVKDSDSDLRDVEIWVQANWYLKKFI